MYTPKDIYDVENYALLGEIKQDTAMGRWSVGFFYSEKDDKWYFAITKGNNNSFAEPGESRDRATEGTMRKQKI